MSRGINLVLVRLAGAIQIGKEPNRALRTAGPLPSTGSEVQRGEAAQGAAPSHHLVSRKGKKRGYVQQADAGPLEETALVLGSH